MKKIKTMVTYLSTKLPFNSPAMDVPLSIQFSRLKPLKIDEYLDIYSTIGAEYHWTERLLMNGDELLESLQSPNIIIQKMSVNKKFAGYYELDCSNKEKIQIVYFGLEKTFIGRGYGKILFHHLIKTALNLTAGERILWVHTCDLDHPQALPFYKKVGFNPYCEQWEEVALPDS